MTREEAIDILEWGRPYDRDDDRILDEFKEALKLAVADMRKVEEVGKAIKELKIVLESYEAVEHTQGDYRQGMIDGMTRCIKPIEELTIKEVES